MSTRWLFTLVAVACASAFASFAIGTATGGGKATKDASGNQVVQSGPHVYDQTTAEYAGSWIWSQQSANYDYYYYIFLSSGSLATSGHNASGGGGSWSGAPTVYYFKEYNNEPLGSGHNNILSVDYCC